MINHFIILPKCQWNLTQLLGGVLSHSESHPRVPYLFEKKVISPSLPVRTWTLIPQHLPWTKRIKAYGFFIGFSHHSHLLITLSTCLRPRGIGCAHLSLLYFVTSFQFSVNIVDLMLFFICCRSCISNHSVYIKLVLYSKLYVLYRLIYSCIRAHTHRPYECITASTNSHIHEYTYTRKHT